MIKTKDNLVGQIFRRLIVLERAPDRVQPSGQKNDVDTSSELNISYE